MLLRQSRSNSFLEGTASGRPKPPGMAKPKILAFAGSIRKGSFNKQLLKVAVESLRQAGAEVSEVDLADYDMPILNQDYEAAHGLPPAAIALQDLLFEHDGLFLACPEYNSSITPLLKNTLDWISRPNGERASTAGFRGKPAALVGASGGALGGLRGLRHVREILGNIGMLVLPGQLALSKAHEAFTPEGELAEPAQQKSLESVTKPLVEFFNRG